MRVIEAQSDVSAATLGKTIGDVRALGASIGTKVSENMDSVELRLRDSLGKPDRLKDYACD